MCNPSGKASQGAISGLNRDRWTACTRNERQACRKLKSRKDIGCADTEARKMGWMQLALCYGIWNRALSAGEWKPVKSLWQRADVISSTSKKKKKKSAIILEEINAPIHQVCKTTRTAMKASDWKQWPQWPFALPNGRTRSIRKHTFPSPWIHLPYFSDREPPGGMNCIFLWSLIFQ